MAVTIKDVAALAGVSPSTVSGLARVKGSDDFGTATAFFYFLILLRYILLLSMPLHRELLHLLHLLLYYETVR